MRQIPEATYIQVLVTPFLTWVVGAESIGLRWIESIPATEAATITQNPNEHTQKTVQQLSEYFESKRMTFDVPLDLTGYSDFSTKVWQMLQTIPYGKTISYKELAIRLGDVKCIRAAASANGRNPIPIIIPCHRVIGSDGSLTGYALGLEVKKYLLDLEQPWKSENRQMELFL